MSIDFWIGVGTLAGIYGIFTLGLQLNAGFTGILNFGQAGFMAVGAYAFAIAVADWAWPWWSAALFGVALAAAAGVAVGAVSLRLRSDYFAIATIAFAEIARYTLQNAEFAGGNQGVLGFDDAWRGFASWVLELLTPLGLGERTQLPLLIIVWIAFAILVVLLRFLEKSPWGRVLKAIREDEDAAAALGKDVLTYRLQSLAIAAALAAVAGILVALNVTYLYPSIFDPTFTFLGYAILVLGGFASYLGVAAGALVLWAIMEGTRFIDFGLSGGQQAALRFAIVGLFLILLSALRPQGLLGSRAEMVVKS